jgi:hypothetical protein
VSVLHNPEVRKIFKPIEDTSRFQRAWNRGQRAFHERGAREGANSFMYHFLREGPESNPDLSSLFTEIGDELREAALKGLAKFKIGAKTAAIGLLEVEGRR